MDIQKKTFDNIRYELEQAQGFHKSIIVVEIPSEIDRKTNVSINLPSIIYETDYSDKKRIKYEVIDSLDMKDIKAKVFDIDKKLFSESYKDEGSYSWLLLEEYKIMLETSEK